MDKVLVVGDANVDITIPWTEAEGKLGGLSPKHRKLLSSLMSQARDCGCDVECYYDSFPEEMSSFLDSFKGRVGMGGCGAIKSCAMSRMSGSKVYFWGSAGADGYGKLVKGTLLDSGVVLEKFTQEGCTYKTYNLFHPRYNRLAISSWGWDFDAKDIISFAKKQPLSKILLAGAHRLPKKSLGYRRIAEEFPEKTYVFTGSFACYSGSDLRKKYKQDLSRGVLVLNDSEAGQIARALTGKKLTILDSLKAIGNEYVVMHGPHFTAVKTGDRIIASPTHQINKKRVKELTGIGDVWESVFLSQVTSLGGMADEELIRAQQLASEAACLRMLTAKSPELGGLRKIRFLPDKKGAEMLGPV
ncbi:MAG: carbohydrate kinase family protein [Candidatus Altiarchaeota archaeon]|nr:carbohydrate kinase family protein [Candidatus Altiarchaeota archaeon]